MKFNFIEGGVCAPAGFLASGVLAGIKKNSVKKDLALVFSERDCCAAGMFTKNVVKAEPVLITRDRVSPDNPCSRQIRGIVANSGNANACTGEEGRRNALRMTDSVEKELKVPAGSVLVCSTGVIGQQLNIDAVEKAVPSLAAGLGKNGNADARVAIMTTDTVYKECAVEFEIKGKKVRIGAMAKGSGMIHINMGTMLAFITTDADISQKMLYKALKTAGDATFNCVSVDGDTSTNDTLLILANGAAGNIPVTAENEDYGIFLEALTLLSTEMAKKIAGDGEGATHLIECNVEGAKSLESARVLAKSVISSSLVKAAFFGKDANWGRILCALGYSGELFNPRTVDLSFENSKGRVEVYHQGVPLDFDEEKAKVILSEQEVKIYVKMNEGTAKASAWGCDLTYDYVKINGDYRT
ncbi:MAG: bifunctional ornithine acetyltransferase/N-acetylglutamate synthase [Spirochaetes bacterium]|uniref:Arginine biosynthesis bifunctional protein ArgJ n=1 Tax=Candidatus Gallitreponema excrementavium TaxID=2840840 RepID=A0A9D9HP44_9SPIR|nr:bifunctional ornithine acetyltransferase/N-acetylglutamate synthase [Candidatus Gallitreponema excrementavium]